MRRAVLIGSLEEGPKRAVKSRGDGGSGATKSMTNKYKKIFAFLMALLAFLSVASWSGYASMFPEISHETVQLDSAKRQHLTALRDEEKFEPYEYSSDSYTGIATPEDGITARAAVNDAIDALLSRHDGPLPAATVAALIGRAMQRVDLLETEDRDRTAGYMIEIWYLLGFKGATGQFAFGSHFPHPEGYAEPLPPGWKSQPNHVRSGSTSEHGAQIGAPRTRWLPRF